MRNLLGNAEMSGYNYARWKNSKEEQENTLEKRCERWAAGWLPPGLNQTARVPTRSLSSPPPPPWSPPALNQSLVDVDDVTIRQQEQCPCKWLSENAAEDNQDQPAGCGFLAFEDMSLKHPQPPYQQWYLLSGCLFGLFMLVQCFFIYRRWRGGFRRL